MPDLDDIQLRQRALKVLGEIQAYREKRPQAFAEVFSHASEAQRLRLLNGGGRDLLIGSNEFLGALWSNPKIFLVAMDMGVPVDANLHRNMTALKRAVKGGDIEMVKTLIARGAYVDHGGSEQGYSPLIVSSHHHDDETVTDPNELARQKAVTTKIVALLLEAGASLEIPGVNNPLLAMGARNLMDAGLLLIKAGVGRELQPGNPSSVFDKIRELGQMEAADFLEAAMLERDLGVSTGQAPKAASRAMRL